MKNLVKKTAAGVFVAGLTFGFAPAAFAADATPACWVDAVEQAEIHYANAKGDLTQAQAKLNGAKAAKAEAAAKVKTAQEAADKAKADFDATVTDQNKDGDAAKKKAMDDAKAELNKAKAALRDANYDLKAAQDNVELFTNILKNTAEPELAKINAADPDAYNKAHGCKATPAKPDQKPGKDVKPEQKPGKTAQTNNKADNTKKDGKNVPAKVKEGKNVKGGLASTGAVAASLAGIALASVAGGTGVVAWRRHKA